MTTRRNFIKTGGLVAGGLTLVQVSGWSINHRKTFVSRRPPLKDRKFTSEAVEETIRSVKKDIADPELAWMFENCFPNTLDTTVNFSVKNGLPDTFVITGDINAMWLRDSSAQVWPYVPLARKDNKLKDLLQGVIRRQTKCILIDPYANAFNKGPTGSEWDKDLTKMKPELHERKWEVDSLCYPIRLAHGYWKSTGDASFMDDNWLKAMHLVIQTFRVQQRKKNRGPYSFMRVTARQTDTVAGMGYGNPWQPNGMICSVFRPSDDATIYLGYVPSNFFAVVSLRQLAEMADTVLREKELAASARNLADEVETALLKYAIVPHLHYGKIYSFELDGYGNQLFMDDANIPGLLSMPYLGSMPVSDPVYQNTRKFVLDKDNPYFFRGKAAEGIGGPHVGLDMIWPMGIISRALTSNDEHEIAYCLNMLLHTHAGTGFMHESFNKDNPAHFTRKWFAWANTLFGELILKIHRERPEILRSAFADSSPTPPGRLCQSR